MLFKAALATVLLTATALLAAPHAMALGFRCGTDVISRGMTPLEVLERCGEPDYTYGWTDFRYPGIFVHVDEWTYDLGLNKFRRLLTFENGRLVRIETRPKPTGTLRPTGLRPDPSASSPPG